MIKLFRSLAVTSLLSISSLLTAVQPYDSIVTLPQTYFYFPDGWVLYSLVSDNASAVIVDVESTDGGVARYLAQQNIPSVTQIYSISLWQNGEPPEYDRYQRFLSNVIHENTTEVIIPLRMSSSEAAAALNVNADFIYFGSNDPSTLHDEITHWISNLSDNGILAGTNWNENAIKVAVVEAAYDFNLNLGISDNVWYLKKN